MHTNICNMQTNVDPKCWKVQTVRNAPIYIYLRVSTGQSEDT